jgi:hypothetical protein
LVSMAVATITACATESTTAAAPGQRIMDARDQLVACTSNLSMKTLR